MDLNMMKMSIKYINQIQFSMNYFNSIIGSYYIVYNV